MRSHLFKIPIGLLLILTTSLSFCQHSKDITFEKRIQKFKKVKEGEVIELVYWFDYKVEGVNALSEVLSMYIEHGKLDCSCTEVILPDETISPNSRGKIVVKFNTRDKIGFQERKVLLRFYSSLQDSSFIEKEIIFKGVVKASKETKEAYKHRKK